MKLIKIEASTPFVEVDSVSSIERDGTLTKKLPDVVKTLLLLNFLKEDGTKHLHDIDASEMELLESEIGRAANSLGEEPDLSKCELIRSMATAVAGIPLDSAIRRIDFICGANADGRYEPAAFVVSAKERAHGVKEGQGGAVRISACYKCPKTGSVLDTDIDAAPINADLKAMAKAVYACEGGKYKEINGLMLEEDQPDTPITKTEMRPESKTEMVKGKAVRKTVQVPHEVPQYDYHPITENGEKVMVEVSPEVKAVKAIKGVEAQPAIANEAGEIIQAAIEGVTAVKSVKAKPAVFEQDTFKVAKMKKGKKVSQKNIDRLAELLAS